MVVPVVAALFIIGELLTYYRGRYIPPAVARPPVEGIRLPSYISSTAFREAPQQRRGVVLVDTAHFNDLDASEMKVLLSRITARGYTLDYLGPQDPRNYGATPNPGERPPLLAQKLRGADSFLVMVPLDEYSTEEVDLVKAFVRKGGKLLLVSDPTRFQQTSSLASAFGFTFATDFLYNVPEHETNYQHVFLADFKPDPLTANLRRVTFYIASSISPSTTGLIFTDENTYSNFVDRREPFTTMVKDPSGLVVGVSDLTFMTEPFNAITDNDQLVSNLADFLTTSRRTFELADFPHLFKGDVDIVFKDPSLLDSSGAVRALLAGSEGQVRLQDSDTLERDTVFVGLLGDTMPVAHWLASGGVRVSEGLLRTSFTPAIPVDGAGLLFLYRDADRYVLLVLADRRETLGRLVDHLRTGKYREGLVGDMLGVYRLAELASPQEPLPVRITR
ncbi:MAG: hypothetical protein HY686_01280 [Chloroflexi bacterium]|nr:hypothetical protein [Chloroflexota bacterium]